MLTVQSRSGFQNLVTYMHRLSTHWCQLSSTAKHLQVKLDDHPCMVFSASFHADTLSPERSQYHSTHCGVCPSMSQDHACGDRLTGTSVFVSFLVRHFCGGDSSEQVCFCLSTSASHCAQTAYTRFNKRGRTFQVDFFSRNFSTWVPCFFLSNHVDAVHIYEQD